MVVKQASRQIDQLNTPAATARKLPIKILDNASGKVRGRAAETQEFIKFDLTIFAKLRFHF